jgi:PEP-CTERM motif
MNNKRMKRRLIMNMKLSRKLSSFIIVATAIVFVAPAAAFTLRDDPSSTWGGDSSSQPTTNGNIYTVQNLLAQNLTSNPLPELSFAIPFVWQKTDSTYLPMEWRNDLNGWYTSNFNNTGTSLTISLTSPVVSSVLMGELADVTGGLQLPLTEPCFGSPSCIGGTGQPLETRNTTDLIPLFSLGSFAPNETKRFDVSFSYSFGDHRSGIGGLETSFFGYTVSPIPEPETYAMFIAGLGLMGFMARRHKAS